MLTNEEFPGSPSNTETDSTGMYCFQVAPGQYVVRPITTVEEENRGMLLSPLERSVTIERREVLDIDFSQVLCRKGS